jgi:pimeloyl-ACP methyl ester carboxylesterase
MSTTQGRQCVEAIHGPAPGDFLETEHGSTHFILEGPENGKLVVLQHGLGGNTWVFDAAAKALVEKGYRVLRYDFYDRGYSETDSKYDIPSIGVHSLDFTLDVYVEQLRQVLEALGLDKTKLIHVGHSLGGATGIGYASKHPEQVNGLVLMSAVCLEVSKPFTAKLADTPILGNLLVKMVGLKTFSKFSTSSCYDPEHPKVKEFLGKQARTAVENPRFFASVRSTNGNCRGMVGSLEDEYRLCCQSGFPIHLIWGKADQSVPYDNCIQMKKIATELGVQVSEDSFANMPHNVMFPDAEPEKCAKSIVKFVESSFA